MRLIAMLVLMLIMASFSTSGAVADEKVFKALGSGGSEIHAAGGFVKPLAEGDDLIRKFCTGCHTEARIFNKLKEMHSDSSVNYEKDLKSIVVKKIRLTGGNISHQDGKKILAYLSTL